jgi:hypothetical protein
MNQSAAVVAQRGLRRGPAGSGQAGREKLGLARGWLGRSVLGDGGTGAPVCRVADAGAGSEARKKERAGVPGRSQACGRKRQTCGSECVCAGAGRRLGGRLCGVVCGSRERSPALIPRLTAIIRRS